MIFTIEGREYSGDFFYILKQIFRYQSATKKTAQTDPIIRIKSHLSKSKQPLSNQQTMAFIENQVETPANQVFLEFLENTNNDFKPLDRESATLALQAFVCWFKYNGHNGNVANIDEQTNRAKEWIETALMYGVDTQYIQVVKKVLAEASSEIHKP